MPSTLCHMEPSDLRGIAPGLDPERQLRQVGETGRFRETKGPAEPPIFFKSCLGGSMGESRMERETPASWCVCVCVLGFGVLGGGGSCSLAGFEHIFGALPLGSLSSAAQLSGWKFDI